MLMHLSCFVSFRQNGKFIEADKAILTGEYRECNVVSECI